MQYDILKLNTGSISFSNRKYKWREKTSDKRKKMKEKKKPHPPIKILA